MVTLLVSFCKKISKISGELMWASGGVDSRVYKRVSIDFTKTMKFMF